MRPVGDTAFGGVWREEPLALPLGGAGAARGAANVFGPPFPLHGLLDWQRWGYRGTQTAHKLGLSDVAHTV